MIFVSHLVPPQSDGSPMKCGTERESTLGSIDLPISDTFASGRKKVTELF